jgi:hypothetical protein
MPDRPEYLSKFQIATKWRALRMAGDLLRAGEQPK